MNNILIITDLINCPPSSKLVFEYSEQLKKNGAKVEFLAIDSLDPLFSFYKIPFVFNLVFKDLSDKSWYSRLDKLLIILLKTCIDTIFFNKKQFKFLTSQINKPDLILHFVTGNTFISTFKAAKIIKDKYKSKYHIHFFDPKPGILEWGEKQLVIRNTIPQINQFISSADKITAISKELLDIIKSYYNLKLNNVEVLSFPINNSLHLKKFKVKNDFTIVYIGSIYGKRDIRPILLAFNKLKEYNENIKLIFVGSGLNNKSLENLLGFKIEGIEIVSWTNNVELYIENADILLDLNSCIENDPFISSKLAMYLGYSRPVLTISATNSSSHKFASGFQSVYFAKNEVSSIQREIIKISEIEHDFTIRDQQIRKYSVEHLVSNNILE